MSYKELARFLKILSDPSRLEILDLLSCGELCTCDLLEHFHFSQPTLSHHMKVLVKNHLVITHKIGNKHMYQLNKNLFESVINNLATVHTSNQRCICHALNNGKCS
ncbi:ArsR/SmtB family transcription factor [Staphylococcus argenteus]|uniref:ArsR/SmtB family transcription factor n=1 Tax=Staphylococcus argenteus TaxID=985002 RepID=UPI000501A827|nr:metalloregulator ArsR/SmtB family transcription factor [Staphylococcus argenteus]MBE2134429.1 winged helix-turn-helix transcriptional regulator [Staphylococcus argenteus]MBE2147216.1 winged helix-turn-helix transcriptional regulator [Staphylococcus argenteus]MBE2162208.1 winged helix-turn-helix transcriptional regulator [Staphylococcus argenteus]MCG9796269.1 metalloregulator ArsR/SmtB family transcription factor [Staphylococcus argenteus]MCG9798534.1 metalloregulator ArsR/SmtB family transc